MIQQIKDIQEKISKYKNYIKDNNIDEINEITFYPIAKDDYLEQKYKNSKMELYYYQTKFIERKLSLLA